MLSSHTIIQNLLLLLVVIATITSATNTNTNTNHPLRKLGLPNNNKQRGWRRSSPSPLPQQHFIRNHRRMTDDDVVMEDDEQQQQQVGWMQECSLTSNKAFLTRGGTLSTASSVDSFYSVNDELELEEEDGLELTSLLPADTTALTTLRGGAKATKNASTSSSSSSMTSSVFNLVNNVAGAGILALSAGMAGGTGWIPACAICVLLGILSSHTFRIIGTACELTDSTNFKELWARTVGPETTWMVDSIIAFMCVACSIIYSGILGDVFTPLIAESGLVPAQYNTRASNIIAITSVLLLPLSLIKNLSALAFTSILGFLSIAYTVVFIVIRALDGSYTLGSGRFVELVTPQGTPGAGVLLDALPSFERTSLWGIGFTSLVLMSNLGLAFIAHYNSPTFYRQLKDTNSKRFGTMVNISFTILVLLYIVTMTAGYSTFGDVCRGNLLLNYHPHDILSTLGRLATGFSILFGFPLVMCGARESLIGAASSLGLDAVGKDQFHFPLVASMLVFITCISCLVEDVSLVVGLTGAAMGSFIVYICPPLLYAGAVKLAKGEKSDEYRKAKYSLALVPFGLFVGSLGVYMTIKEGLAK